MFTTLARYEEAALGLPYPVVLLDGAETAVDPETDESLGVSVPDAEQMAAAAALALCAQSARLIGPEVRFIRHAMDVSAQATAELLGMDPATLSRWENGKQQLGEWADRALRMAAVLNLLARFPELGTASPARVAARLRDRAAGEHPAIVLRRVAVGRGQKARGIWLDESAARVAA